MAGLWNDTLTEARRLDSESRLLNGYLQCGDWMHDYIQPYMDVVFCGPAPKALSQVIRRADLPLWGPH